MGRSGASLVVDFSALLVGVDFLWILMSSTRLSTPKSVNAMTLSSPLSACYDSLPGRLGAASMAAMLLRLKGRPRSAFRRFGRCRHRAALNIAGVEKRPDEFEHALIGHSRGDARHQAVVIDSVEKLFEIEIGRRDGLRTCCNHQTSGGRPPIPKKRVRSWSGFTAALCFTAVRRSIRSTPWRRRASSW